MNEPQVLWYVCGDCGTRLLAEGGEKPAGTTTIPYGTTCRAHDKPLPMVATMGVLMPVSYVAPALPPDEEEDEEERYGTTTPLGVGPLTRIAADLLIAWTTEGKEGAADTWRIECAVEAARKLIKMTGSA